MRLPRPIALLVTTLPLLLAASASAQSKDALSGNPWSALPGQTDARPHAPWIFRCTLDGRPRMVVLALHRDLWVAYDAEGCRLDTAWRGGVTLDGSVYTGAHGPNPSMEGTILVRGDASPFVLISGGQRTAVVPVWRGYRVEEGRAILTGEFEVDGRTVRIEESPEAVMHEGAFSLERRFTVEGLPAGATLGVVVPSRDAAGGKALRVCVENGALIDDLVAVVQGGTTVVTLELPTEEAGR
jgi:hypothetical protein